ncbi:MAG: hypothetical protein JNM07_04115 [Phycisphaerae bacterium]|nr:hypothetical protein [Phycisphaerae bacterium]
MPIPSMPIVPNPAPRPGEIDALMERASNELVGRRYAEAEELALEALRMAHADSDFERMARILLPLQEARRQLRDLAFDSGAVRSVNGELPLQEDLRTGCYLIEPPRVGVDGRVLRERAARARVPVIVVVREPVTRDGLWPLVAVGPATVRVKVPLPPTPAPKRASPSKSRATVRRVAVAPKRTPDAAPLPVPAWFLLANEALGDAAIAQVNPALEPRARVEAFYARLAAHPDHEKLHQRLAEACREAALRPRPALLLGATNGDRLATDDD